MFIIAPALFLFVIKIIEIELTPWTQDVKWGLHWQIFFDYYYYYFIPHFMCWKYFDEFFMDKNLLHMSLTKFNNLNKRRKPTFLMA